MRNPLNKRIPRELKSNIGRYICIFILLTTTIMLGACFLAVAESASLTLEDNQKNCKVENGQFETVVELTDDILEAVEDKGVDVYPNYYATVNEFQEHAKLYVFNERTEINLASVFEGSMPQNANEVAIDRLFAVNNELLIGDEVVLNDTKYTVSGYISLPDYNSLFMDNKDVVMNTKDFGVAVTTKEGFERFDEENITYRYSYHCKDSNLSDQEKRDIAADITEVMKENMIPVQSFITDEFNQSITFLSEDIGHDVPMMKIFVYILVVIIAFVFAVLTNNTIESEASIIGTLRASGYKKSEIVVHYMTPTMIVALLSSIVGNILGYTVMIAPLTDIYYTTYCLPPFETYFSWEAFISSTVLPIVIMLLMNLIMLNSTLSLSPLRFLRGDIKRSKQKKAIKLPAVSFLSRFRMRVLLQNKSSYIVLFLGIFLSSFLLMFGIGLNPLMDHYVDGIDDSLPYEYQYILKAPVEVDGGEQIRTYAMDIYYPLAGNDIEATFIGISEDSEFFPNMDLPDKKNEIVITSPLSKKLGIKVGDELQFTDSYKEKDHTFKVVGISEYDATLGAFMKKDLLNELLDSEEGYFNCYLSNEKLDIEDAYVSKFITRADMISAADQMMVSFKGVIWFISVFSVIIYLVLMYLLTKTVIDKNAIHISFMKVFGYNSKEVNKLYLTATTITVIVSLLVCIPLEVVGFRLILVYLSCLMEGYMEFYLPQWVYFSIIAIGLVTYFGINAIHVYRVKKIPMSLALKNRE